MPRSGAHDPDSVRPVTDAAARDERAVLPMAHVDDDHPRVEDLLDGLRWYRTLLEGPPA